MSYLPAKLSEKIQERINNDSLRSMVVGQKNIDFASNDYLGFSRSEQIYKTTLERLENMNSKSNGSTGSRLLSGNNSFFSKLENQLATFHNAEDALIYNSGYVANIGLISCIAQRGDLILYDEFIHASIRDGIRLSNAKAYKFKHNDLVDLEQLITRVKTANSAIYVITESIFSMDGDQPELCRLVELSKQFDLHLIIDEAHATGVIGANGEGLVQVLNLETFIFARIHTFGKALGCHGAVVLCSKKLKQYLINFSKAFIYTTALPPHSLANISVVYDNLAATNELKLLKQRIIYFKEKLREFGLRSYFIESNSSIQSCIIGNNSMAKKISNELAKVGFDVKAILNPTVPKEMERLRFCLHSYNSIKEIEDVLQFLSNLLKNHSVQYS